MIFRFQFVVVGSLEQLSPIALVSFAMETRKLGMWLMRAIEDNCFTLVDHWASQQIP